MLQYSYYQIMFFTLIGYLCLAKHVKHLHCKNVTNENRLNHFICRMGIYIRMR